MTGPSTVFSTKRWKIHGLLNSYSVGTSSFRTRCTTFYIHSSILIPSSYVSVLFHSCFSHLRVFGKTLVHEFYMFFSLTEWCIFSESWKISIMIMGKTIDRTVIDEMRLWSTKVIGEHRPINAPCLPRSNLDHLDPFNIFIYTKIRTLKQKSRL